MLVHLVFEYFRPQVIKPEMKEFLMTKLKQKAVVALVGGSDRMKMQEQMGGDDGELFSGTEDFTPSLTRFHFYPHNCTIIRRVVALYIMRIHMLFEHLYHCLLYCQLCEVSNSRTGLIAGCVGSWTVHSWVV